MILVGYTSSKIVLLRIEERLSNMPGPLSIMDFREGKKAKLPMLHVKVQKRIDDYTYLIRDNSDVARLTIIKNPGLGKKLTVGIFVRLVDPAFDGKVFVLQRAPLLIPPFNLDDYDEEDEKSEDEDPQDASSLKTFKDIDAIPVRTCVPTVIAKVTSLSPIKPCDGPSKYHRVVGLTDHRGEKAAANLFGDITGQVEKDKVYKFKNFEKRDFKKKTDAHNWLGSRSNSGVTEVEGQLASLFDSIEEPGDGIIIGTVLGHEKPRFYWSCPSCKKGMPETAASCPKCNNEMSNTSPLRDFFVILQVVDNEDNIKEVKCFRSTLAITTDGKKDEDIDEELHGLSDKECKIYFKNDQKDEKITVLKIELERTTD